MLPIYVVGIVAVVAILAWRGSQADRNRVKARLRKANETKPKVQPRAGVARNAAPTLEKDPETGVYKLRDE
ncbi:MAG: hypothetical protein KDK07_12945 [Bauldia sp.]|nr:hypothetical protein [Bauldia sp.]